MTKPEIAKVNELLDRLAQTYVRDYKARIIDAIRKMPYANDDPLSPAEVIQVIEAVPAVTKLERE